MSKKIVKICGITNQTSLQIAINSKADLVGFIFVKESPRYIKPKKAQALMKVAKEKEKKSVAVFQDQPLSIVLNILKETKADLVQLHGNESIDFISKLNIPVIKTIRPDSQSERKTFETMSHYQKFVEFFLFDRQAQGQGQVLSSQLVNNFAKNFPVILAGGLNPENIAEVAKTTNNFVSGYDVSSGVENELGVKDLYKSSKFVETIRQISAKKITI